MGRRERLGGRRSRKKAQIAIMRLLYRDVLVIIERLVQHLDRLRAFNVWMSGPAEKASPEETTKKWIEYQITLRHFRVDLFALYEWTYAVENSIKAFRLKRPIDLTELERLSIFRSKLVVHPATTALHQSVTPQQVL
jgi:hypothetical protein